MSSPSFVFTYVAQKQSNGFFGKMTIFSQFSETTVVCVHQQTAIMMSNADQMNMPNNHTSLNMLKSLKRKRSEGVIAQSEVQVGCRKRSRHELQKTNISRPAVTVIYPEKVDLEKCKKQESPVSVVKAILGKHHVEKMSTIGDDMTYCSEPTESEMMTYAEMVKSMRGGDLKKLREYHASGKSLDACNRFGESFIHMACRRGKLDMVSFLIDEAKVRVVRRDDYGRIPLHDAIWTSQPNFDVVDKLIANVPPSLLLATDKRGHTCFDYARREHWEAWAKFLNERKPLLQARLEEELSGNNIVA